MYQRSDLYSLRNQCLHAGIGSLDTLLQDPLYFCVSGHQKAPEYDDVHCQLTYNHHQECLMTRRQLDKDLQQYSPRWIHNQSTELIYLLTHELHRLRVSTYIHNLSEQS